MSLLHTLSLVLLVFIRASLALVLHPPSPGPGHSTIVPCRPFVSSWATDPNDPEFIMILVRNDVTDTLFHVSGNVDVVSGYVTLTLPNISMLASHTLLAVDSESNRIISSSRFPRLSQFFTQHTILPRDKNEKDKGGKDNAPGLLTNLGPMAKAAVNGIKEFEKNVNKKDDNKNNNGNGNGNKGNEGGGNGHDNGNHGNDGGNNSNGGPPSQSPPPSKPPPKDHSPPPPNPPSPQPTPNSPTPPNPPSSPPSSGESSPQPQPPNSQPPQSPPSQATPSPPPDLPPSSGSGDSNASTKDDLPSPTSTPDGTVNAGSSPRPMPDSQQSASIGSSYSGDGDPEGGSNGSTTGGYNVPSTLPTNGPGGGSDPGTNGNGNGSGGNTPTSGLKSSGHSNKVGAIVGGVLGVLAFFALSFFVLFLIRRRNQHRRSVAFSFYREKYLPSRTWLDQIHEDMLEAQHGDRRYDMTSVDNDTVLINPSTNANSVPHPDGSGNGSVANSHTRPSYGYETGIDKERREAELMIEVDRAMETQRG